MSFLVKGKIINVFKEEDFVNTTTGEVKEGRDRVQVLTSKKLNNGTSSFELILFGTKAPELYKDHLNKNTILSFSNGVYQTDNNKVGQFFILDDAENRDLLKNKPE